MDFGSAKDNPTNKSGLGKATGRTGGNGKMTGAGPAILATPFKKASQTITKGILAPTCTAEFARYTRAIPITS